MSYVQIITETSPYKSDPRFPLNIIIIKMGEIWGRNQNDKNGYMQRVLMAVKMIIIRSKMLLFLIFAQNIEVYCRYIEVVLMSTNNLYMF